MAKVKRNIKRNCVTCGKTFLATKKEVNRGNAHYCSLSCAATGNNQNRLKNAKLLNVKCNFCGNSFETKNPQKKYCCQHCKQKATYRKRHSTHSNRFKQLRVLPCEVCKWDLAPRDLHHVKAISEGGTDSLDNVIVLCPNCHRLAHNNLLSQDELLKLVKLRTISSSSEEEVDAQAGN